jgi:hypothetical protein
MLRTKLVASRGGAKVWNMGGYCMSAFLFIIYLCRFLAKKIKRKHLPNLMLIQQPRALSLSLNVDLFWVFKKCAVIVKHNWSIYDNA